MVPAADSVVTAADFVVLLVSTADSVSDSGFLSQPFSFLFGPRRAVWVSAGVCVEGLG